MPSICELNARIRRITFAARCESQGGVLRLRTDMGHCIAVLSARRHDLIGNARKLGLTPIDREAIARIIAQWLDEGGQP